MSGMTRLISPVPSWKPNTVGKVYQSLFPNGNASGVPVQFAAANYEPPHLTPLIKHPRPLAETNSYAISRRWYPGLKWRIPVCVSGLSWPMYFTVDGPPGMNFPEPFPVLNGATGEYEMSDDYGYLEWDNPTVGTHEYTITVYGQNGGFLQVTTELEVTIAGFRFLSATGDDAAPGNINFPKLTLESYFNGSYGDFTIIILGGSYTPAGTLNVQASMPKVIIGDYDSTRPVLTMTGAQFPINAGGDVCFANIDFDYSNQSLADPRIIYGTTNWSDGHRSLFYDLSFDHFNQAAIGDDNPGPIAFLAPAVYRDYVCFSNLSIDNSASPTNSGLLGSWYQLRYSHVDNVTVGSNVSCTRVILLKASCWDFGVHRVYHPYANNNMTNGVVQPFMGMGGDGSLPNDLIEVSYCRIRSDNFSDHYALKYAGGIQAGPQTPRLFVHRNNIFGRVGYGGSTTAATTATINNNVIMTEYQPALDPEAGNITLITYENLEGDELAGYLDSNLDIAGTALSTYAGIRGANMYSGV